MSALHSHEFWYAVLAIALTVFVASIAFHLFRRIAGFVAAAVVLIIGLGFLVPMVVGWNYPPWEPTPEQRASAEATATAKAQDAAATKTSIDATKASIGATTTSVAQTATAPKSSTSPEPSKAPAATTAPATPEPKVVVVTATPVVEIATAVPVQTRPSTTATAVPLPADVNGSGVVVQDLGLWVFEGNRPALPATPKNGEVIVAQGDITNSGKCNVKIFTAGQAVTGLGDGTFRLVRISGTPSEIAQAVAAAQNSAASGNTGGCPRLG